MIDALANLTKKNMPAKKITSLLLIGIAVSGACSFHFGILNEAMKAAFDGQGKTVTATGSKNDDPKATPYADQFYMPFTETLYLQNDFYTNKQNPSTTNGEFYYHFSSGMQLVKRDNCMGDRFASAIRNLENTPCWHIIRPDGKK